MHKFAETLLTGNLTPLETLLTEDVTFNSPVSSVFQGRQMALAILTGAIGLLKEQQYADEIVQADLAILRFRALVKENELEGCYFLKTNEEGRIREITVMMRPLPAAIAFNEGMEAYKMSQQQKSSES